LTALGPGLAEEAVADGLDGSHDLGADLRVVPHPKVPGPLGIQVAAQEPLGMDGPPAGLGIGAGGGLGAGALLAQLAQGGALRHGHQAGLGRGVDACRLGHGRGLGGRKLSRPGGGGRRRQLLQTPRRGQASPAWLTDMPVVRAR
jgi:hypothetical protein